MKGVPVADYDAVIIGAGPGGEVALNTLLTAGRRVALVENGVIGGECSNWGCIPTKTLLRPTELEGKCERAAGVTTPGLDFERLAAYRDYMVSSHDDSTRVVRYEERGVAVFKDSGRIDGPGRVAVNGRVLETGAIIVATGADAVVPPIPGLAEAGYWTNREATDLTEIPESAVVVGGGAVGIELAQFLARFGTRVTLVQGPQRLADREAPEIGDALAEILDGDGIELRLGVHARVRAARGRGASRLARRRHRGPRRGRCSSRPAGGPGRRASASRRSGSSRASAASRSTSVAGPRRAFGRSATSPESQRSRTSPSTRAVSRLRTSSARRRRPTIARCRGSSSPIPRSRPWA